MDYSDPKIKLLKKLAIIVLVIILAFAIYGFTKNNRFKVASTIPSKKPYVATSIHTFVVFLNRDLKPNVDYMKNITDPEKIVKEVSATPQVITIITSQLDNNKHYNFSINNIESANGSKINKVEFDFTSRYIPFNKLSKKEQDIVSKQNDKTAIDNPILKFLPFGGLDFSLSAEFNEEEESTETGGLVLRARLLLSGADVRTNKTQAIEDYKREVTDYIKSLGFDPTKYTIVYEVVEPTI